MKFYSKKILKVIEIFSKRNNIIATATIYKYQLFNFTWYQIRTDGAYMRRPYTNDDCKYNNEISVSVRQAKMEAKIELEKIKENEQ